MSRRISACRRNAMRFRRGSGSRTNDPRRAYRRRLARARAGAYRRVRALAACGETGWVSLVRGARGGAAFVDASRRGGEGGVMEYGKVWAELIGPREATPKDAQDVLLGHLRFGDAGQIDALILLRIAECLIGSEYKCADCDGTGYADEGYGECSNCGRECMYC